MIRMQCVQSKAYRNRTRNRINRRQRKDKKKKAVNKDGEIELKRRGFRKIRVTFSCIIGHCDG